MANSQTDGPWNAKLRIPVDVLALGNWVHQVDTDRSHGRPRTSSTGTDFLQICRSSTMDTLPHKQSDLEGDSQIGSQRRPCITNSLLFWRAKWTVFKARWWQCRTSQDASFAKREELSTCDPVLAWIGYCLVQYPVPLQHYSIVHSKLDYCNSLYVTYYII